MNPILGPDYEKVIAEIIEEHLQDLQDQATDNEPNILAFLESIEPTRKAIYRRLKQAEKTLTQYRKNHDMRAFNWSLESRENVRAYIGRDLGKGKLPRTIEQKQNIVLRRYLAQKEKGDDTQKAVKTRDLDMLRRCTKLKPEYQGDKFPLKVNQMKRKIYHGKIIHRKRLRPSIETARTKALGEIIAPTTTCSPTESGESAR